MKKRILFAVGVLAGLMVFRQPGSVNVYAAGAVCGDFTITGGKEGVDYSLENGTLRILTNTPITIKNTDSSAPTGQCIEIAGDVNADVTLSGVNIEVDSVSSGQGRKAALAIKENSTGNVTIRIADGSENYLRSGWNHAGLEKSGEDTAGTLRITGNTGMLEAVGGRHGAGIGGGSAADTGNITIENVSVTAVGGYGAAGIGGGEGGAGSNIVINDCEVIATSGTKGAGIGGGSLGAGTDIIIENAKVTALGESGGAGIGGGSGCSGRRIAITNSDITATGGRFAAGIGSGDDYTEKGDASCVGESIVIKDSTVSATGGEYGAGIGGGNDSSAKNILILDSDVTAIGNNAKNIGGGSGKIASSSMIIQGDTGTVAGSFMLEEDMVIDKNVTVTIERAASLTVAENVTLENNGTIENKGIIDNQGTLNNRGTIAGVGLIRGNAFEGNAAEEAIEEEAGAEPETSGECGDFTVVGGEPGVDYRYEDGVLTILKSVSITIKNTDQSIATTDRIEVTEGSNIDITLAGVNSDVSSVLDDNMEGVAAFSVIPYFEGNVTVTLADDTENVLVSGSGHAGLEKTGENAKGVLTIAGDTGILFATGGEHGAGIGGGFTNNIIIKGGTIFAMGGTGAAGIGGGYNATGSNITIEGGKIVATGGEGVEGATIIGGIVVDAGGAGIGGGGRNAGRYITITGGTIAAMGKDGGAGIGGGNGGAGLHITIDGGDIIATGDAGGAGIGGGYQYTSSVVINGGEITAIGGDSKDPEGGEGIGRGSGGIRSDVTINGGKLAAVIDGSGNVTDEDEGDTIAGTEGEELEEPATGDSSYLWFYMLLAILSTAGIYMITVQEKKSRIYMR